jgi:hypothetical protein
VSYSGQRPGPQALLEDEPEPELEVSWIVVARGSGDSAGVRVLVPWHSDCAVGICEIHVVEDVHGLDPDFRAAATSEAKALEELALSAW